MPGCGPTRRALPAPLLDPPQEPHLWPIMDMLKETATPKVLPGTQKGPLLVQILVVLEAPLEPDTWMGSLVLHSWIRY